MFTIILIHTSQQCLHLKRNIHKTRCSGCYVSFLLAPVEGWGALWPPCSRVYDPIARGAFLAHCSGPYGFMKWALWLPWHKFKMWPKQVRAGGPCGPPAVGPMAPEQGELFGLPAGGPWTPWKEPLRPQDENLKFCQNKFMLMFLM